MKKLIKNYTTDIPIEKTIAEIQKILSENGAVGIAQDYEEGLVTAIYFRINLNDKILPFKLPVKADSVYQTLFAGKMGERTYGQGRREQAARIAWRICKTWLEAQITLVNLEQAKLEEVFLPYLLVNKDQTLFDTMQNNQFQLPSSTK